MHGCVECVRSEKLSPLTRALQNRLSISSPSSDFCPSNEGAQPVGEHDYPVFMAPPDLSGGDQGPPSEATDPCDHMAASPWYNGTPYGCYPQHGMGQQSYGCSGLEFPSLFEPSLLPDKQYYQRPLGFKPVSIMNMGMCVWVCVCVCVCVLLLLCPY